jgi:hypothetical protein
VADNLVENRRSLLLWLSSVRALFVLDERG